jgi:uncharacterized protein (DUF433 family)/DNA-binding transcriptional MerR regulator
MTHDNTTIVMAFTEEQVARLTGITVDQLRHWDKIKFFVPSLAYENRREAFARLYSFRDVVCLKVLNKLRNESQVSMQHLRSVKQKLAHLGDDLWAKTTLYVLNKKVVFHNPESNTKEEVLSGQGVLQIPLEVVAGNMSEAVAKMRARDESAVGKIDTYRGKKKVRPVVSGTRIPVEAIKEFWEAGYTVDQIRKEYPTLTTEDIKAALDFGAAA